MFPMFRERERERERELRTLNRESSEPMKETCTYIFALINRVLRNCKNCSLTNSNFYCSEQIVLKIVFKNFILSPSF